MASTILQPIADKAATILTGLGLGVNTWADAELTMGRAGAAEIEIPDIGRTRPEQAESQLGADDWQLEYVVSLWVNLTNGPASQQRLVGAGRAVDRRRRRRPDARRLVLDAKVTSAHRQYQLDRRPLVGYETTLAVWKLV
jgi:hypothetical protein